MHTLFIYCLHVVNLILQKISLIVIEVKTLWKTFAKRFKRACNKNNQLRKKKNDTTN